MGKKSGKKKKPLGGKSGDSSVKHGKRSNENSPRAYDNDTAVFILMSQELKDEGNKLFQRRDYEGAMLKYEKALKLLPRNHIDVSYLHSNIAACYMQMGLSEYPRAIHECNLALEVTPKYSKALLKRARCYEALNRLDLSLRDVDMVLKMEPKNLMATEIAERVKTTIEQRGTRSNDISIDMVSVAEHIEPSPSSPLSRLREKTRKSRSEKIEEKKVDDLVEDKKDGTETDEKKAEDKKHETETDEKKAEDKKHETETDEKKAEDKKHETETDEKKAEDKKHETETDEKKAEDKKDETETDEKKAEDKKDETETDEKKAEVKKHGTETDENKAEDKKHEIETDEKKAEDKKHETETNGKKAEDKKHEKKAEDKKHETETDDKKTEDRIEEKKSEVKFEENKAEEKIEEKNAEDKLVVDEKIANTTEEGPRRTVKLVFGEDIRWAQIPINCSILNLREIIRDRYPNSKAVLVKYRDQEGDLVTITTTEELRWAEASTEHGSVRLYIVEVNPDQDPLLGKVKKEEDIHKLDAKQSRIIENGSVGRSKELQNKPCCIDDWIIQFAQLFKNYVGFESDAYLDLHEVGMELYSEAMEETVTSEEAQVLFSTAAEKFQEMAALALFNWGNVHISRARKRVFLTEDASREFVLAQVKIAYDWSETEYSKAGKRYEEALKIKPNFYEAYLALGQQQFEQAKLSWYYAIGTNVDLESWPSTEVFQLYNNAEENMEKGMQMWEEAEEQRLAELSHPSKAKALLQKMKLDDLLKDLSADEAAEQAANMRTQINLLWGTMLYERSIMEFKLGLPVWQECLEVAVEKFELAGASPTDIAVMVKNHCSNDTALEGLGFNIDEIIQAWNEMYEAKRWYSGIPSFRLEPLLRRRVSKLYNALGHT